MEKGRLSPEKTKTQLGLIPLPYRLRSTKEDKGYTGRTQSHQMS